jgi:hypothetical protein
VSGAERVGCRHPPERVPYGGYEASRWIRDHSDVNDRLATNSHCTAHNNPKLCDARNFWLAAYAERRVLVEGWAYTPTANKIPGVKAILGPYWNQNLLQLNDAAFTKPTPEVLGQLRQQYGVRWLVVDVGVNRAPAELQRLAQKRFSSGGIEVYELTTRPS